MRQIDFMKLVTSRDEHFLGVCCRNRCHGAVDEVHGAEAIYDKLAVQATHLCVVKREQFELVGVCELHVQLVSFDCVRFRIDTKLVLGLGSTAGSAHFYLIFIIHPCIQDKAWFMAII